MNKISATVVADSINPQGDRLTSLLITFPRILLSEINTHRMLSKNTSSSRAIPFKKMVEAVQENPFIPIAWQKEHTGMQGSEYLVDEEDVEYAIGTWLHQRDRAIEDAKILNSGGGVTKQLCNRLLEPFMWTTMLITGSKEGWDNFHSLRNPVYEWEYEEGIIKAKSKEEFLEMFIQRYPTNGERDLHDWEAVDEHFDPVDSNFWRSINKGQAEIHLMDLAEKIYDAINESNSTQILPTMWHVPFRRKINELYPEVENDSENIVKISVSMAARASYTIVGESKVLTKEEHISLHDRLLSQNPPHSSPMEHCCICVADEDYNKSFKGEEKGWFRNYKGFKSYRQIIEESK